ncbi:MAG: SMC-Scp complex subunit ScpB [Chloroflexi bacterium]|nr:SMC-Scp complex subunit ScpB [Chloroflexota bacterium]MCI0805441.1 SMC-Scp complex subunit ScpB [Chloroflexota bacterium]MCI0826369.1 SMC-Scp complex subunit ScpB [Chloroflexota bacterium]MCI0852993.1 SMC-Scp complex subunit ScpB [Chloroflexota bacterium]MCI0891023.1 SMC-Scp complex subunit ScpB [Chloroflexota bacterium]
MARDYSTHRSLEVKLEALLFASPGPATVDQLAVALEVRPAQVKVALTDLEAHYAERGLRIQYHKGGAQMTSAPEYAPEIERLLKLDSQAHLSRAALEVLAIITYKQPITRPDLDSIRGVNSDSSLRTLLRHGLIEEIGRTSGPGRPILYGTSGEFLQHFGLSSLEELPRIEASDSTVQTAAPESRSSISGGSTVSKEEAGNTEENDNTADGSEDLDETGKLDESVIADGSGDTTDEAGDTDGTGKTDESGKVNEPVDPDPQVSHGS